MSSDLVNNVLFTYMVNYFFNRDRPTTGCQGAIKIPALIWKENWLLSRVCFMPFKNHLEEHFPVCVFQPFWAITEWPLTVVGIKIMSG